LDWVTAEGREEEVLGALVGYLAGMDGPAWDALELCNVHQDSPTLRLLPQLAEAQGWEVETEVQEVCPVIYLPDNWDEYMASLRGKDRHEQRRKTRRAEALEGIGWYIVGPEHDLEAEVEHFMTLMAKSSPDKAAFLTNPMREFFRQVCRAAYEEGQLQLATMDLDGVKLASYLNFIYRNRVLVYNSGLNWEDDPGFGSGIVLTGYLIARAIEEGRDEFDFMRGDERYKYRFGAQDVTVHRLAIQR
jgi:CelD/BcsL family acetyltransferase involved in cellulose biosynthesis